MGGLFGFVPFLQRVTMSAAPASRRLKQLGTEPACGALPRLGEDTGEAAGLPATGIVLIGTRKTCRYLAAQLASLRQPCVPAGCLLLSALDGQEAPATGRQNLAELFSDVAAEPYGILPPVLGEVNEMVGLSLNYGFRQALVCLPADMSAAEAETARRGIERLVGRIRLPVRFIAPPRTAEEILRGEAASAGEAAGKVSGIQAAGVPRLATLVGSTLTGRERAAIRPLSPEELDPLKLIGRRGAGINAGQVRAMIAGKVVLITGAGGSIGSQLAQVVAGYDPKCVVLMERSENALFQVDQLMARRFPKIARRAVLHDVVVCEQTRRLVAEHGAQIIFHAAAHKHVPLMEDHPGQALSNNLFGTAAIADAALESDAERFVLISTDKAVNPTSAMGASKRLAERYVSSLAAGSQLASRRISGESKTLFSAVRFGNVLASACSVIPIWSQQLAEGGPITVTDPRMTRYFMTIPEAATLVVQAAALQTEPGASPVFVLDMGDPLRIVDLACRFVRLHGAVPEVDLTTAKAEALAELGGPGVLSATLGLGEDVEGAGVPIVFTGARPGEKLYEELAYAKEQLGPTGHARINRQTGEAAVSARAGAEMLRELAPMCEQGMDRVQVVRTMMEWVRRV